MKSGFFKDNHSTNDGQGMSNDYKKKWHLIILMYSCLRLIPYKMHVVQLLKSNS